MASRATRFTLALSFLSLCSVAACGNNPQDGGTGPTGLPGPEGPAGPSGENGMNGTNGMNGLADVSQLNLPGATFFPESLTVSSDGTLYVGSLGTGQVVKFAPGATQPTVFVNSATIANTAGVLVDDTAKLLYVCVTSTTNVAQLRSYMLTDGTLKDTFTDGAFMSCNDMAFDGTGNLYVTDPKAGAVFKVAAGGSTITMWADDTLLDPPSAMAFGADGISFNGTDTLYVNNFATGDLVKIPIMGGGTAGTVAKITVTPALNSPDGMRMLTATSYVTVENNALSTTFPGAAVKIDISGTTATKTIINNRLDAPTSIVKAGNYYYVTEGQLGDFIMNTGKQKIPFLVRRIGL